jgi:hypothetical protein
MIDRNSLWQTVDGDRPFWDGDGRFTVLILCLELLEESDRESCETSDCLPLLREPSIEVGNRVKIKQSFTKVFELSDG